MATRRDRSNRSAAWFFTYDNVNAGMRTEFEKQLVAGGIKDYIFQMEKAPGTGMIHFQGVCRYPNQRETWPCTAVGLHWERCRSWRTSVNYAKKVDTRVDGPWTNMQGIRWRATIRDPMEGLTLFHWQEEILEIIQSEVDSRAVYWYWDPVGATGKSSLAKHIRMNYNCQVLAGSSRNCFCALKARLEEEDIDVVIFDLSRSQRNHMSYNAIEQIKNGMFFSGKYESGDILMNPPHVIVFANFRPAVEEMSEDRWVIRRIGS